MICIGGNNIQGNFNVHRPGSFAGEHSEGTSQKLGQFVHAQQCVAEHRHAADCGALVRHLVQSAFSQAQLAAAVHRGNDQHRNGIGQGLAHSSGDIGHTRSSDDKAYAGFATGPCVAVGHKARALLVARCDVSNTGCR